MGAMKLIGIFSFLFIINLQSSCLFAQQISWQLQPTNTLASLRGLHVVNDTIVWASGSSGTVLRTLDGGRNWVLLTSPDSLDFRSLWAFNEKEAILASAGQPARVYSTRDGGNHWQLIYQDTTGLAFFDALTFADKKKGWLLSDPVNGKILMLQTQDQGTSWKALELPAPMEGEAFFAASNASIAVSAEDKLFIGTGGGAIRILYSADGGSSWHVQEVPMQAISAASGIYALAFADGKKGVAVGGAYDKPAETRFNALYTTNGGKKWLQATKPPQGYRSGLANMPGTSTFVAVGTNGTDISRDGGKTWLILNEENLNSIRFAPDGSKGWAVGAKGRIFVLDVKP